MAEEPQGMSAPRTAAWLAKHELVLSDHTIRRYCKRGILPAQRTSGGHWRIALGAAKQLLERCKEPHAWRE